MRIPELPASEAHFILVFALTCACTIAALTMALFWFLKDRSFFATLFRSMPISWDEYHAMKARVEKTKLQTDIAQAECPESEKKLHFQILEYCASKGYLAFHGSTAHRTFRTKGENDFHCLLPQGRVLWVECKSRRGKLSPDQLAIQAHMRHLGHVLNVITSLDEFINLCESALISLEKKSENSQ